MWFIVSFKKTPKEIEIVPQTWILLSPKGCSFVLWPPYDARKNYDKFRKDVINKKNPDSSCWKKYEVNAIHGTCGKLNFFFQI